ncbi:MAG: hypothetical protein LBG82_01245 [Clostridiales Family XIII bacterium]|jgi:hypothetical protein|nr:hypothetical protein [Clostridiales Family XIII bacterium]
MGAGQEFYSYILAGIGIIVVLFFAMRLREGIRRDQEKKRRMERYRCGPALAVRRYKVEQRTK